MNEDSNTPLMERPPQGLRGRRHWLGLPIGAEKEGTFEDVVSAVPHFGRQPFAMASPNGDEVGVNSFLDMVYKVASRRAEKPVPVGVVSKNYRLVDHHQVLRIVQQALNDNDLDLRTFRIRGEWTVHGERAHFSLLFPPRDSFDIPVAGEDGLRFRIEIFNSVEGSCRLMAVAGWLRSVCANGLILGTALSQIRQQHRQQLQAEELGRVLSEAIELSASDKITLQRWLSTTIQANALNRWADEEVCSRWGVKAATRVLGIARGGRDVEPVGDLRDRTPSQIKTKLADKIPGMGGPADNLFEVSQVLSWVAGQRADVSENLEWRGQVYELMEKLVG